MDCPKCKQKMDVTHTYELGSGKTQRLECSKCLTAATAVTITAIVRVNPGYGEGAGVIAKQIKKNGIRLIQKGIASLTDKTSGKGT